MRRAADGAEPVAVVVVDEAYRVRDALAAIRVDYEPLPAVTSPEGTVRS